MDRKDVIEKVKKCLALGRSDNPHEAMAGIKKAQAMMAQHDISHDDIALSEINRRNTFAHAARRPPEYIYRLVHLISEAFGCEIVLETSLSDSQLEYRKIVNFIGPGSRPEIALYCFDVLRKQLVFGRLRFLKGLSKRMKKTSRTRRADAWAVGWCISVNNAVQAMVPTDREAELIGKFINTEYPSVVKTNARKTKITKRDEHAFAAGYLDGKDVRLHHGVDGSFGPRLIG